MNAKDFMEAEAMGVEPPRRCPYFRGYQKCSFLGQQHTERKTFEYKMSKSGVKYNSLNECLDVAYAWVNNPAKLHKKVRKAIKIAENKERKLLKEGLTQEFNNKFEEFLRLGTIREISQKEMGYWEGPTHYVSTQHVYKPNNN